VVYPSTVGAFAVSIVSVDSHCWPSGEIFVDVCLMARSGDNMWCHGRCRSPCAVWVLLLQSLCHMGVAVMVLAPHRCCSCGPYATCGVAVIVVAPHVVSWSLLLSHMWCHGHGCCTAWASWLWLLCYMGVVVTVIALHGVSQLWSLHCMWHRSCCCCITCGIAVMVVAPCMALQLEGEDGHASVGKGGGRWESTA
jgi:hypothetical protein